MCLAWVRLTRMTLREIHSSKLYFIRKNHGGRIFMYNGVSSYRH
uniref:Uncharacterized protein n=1 Tax=Anguilla anguilla TaxID=7936 RepID=A0A0E9RCW5_ANGAN